MGLSVREQQALRSIEGGLTVPAPWLASRLAMFTRLTAGEAFPARERIRGRWFSGERREGTRPGRAAGSGEGTGRPGEKPQAESLRRKAGG